MIDAESLAALTATYEKYGWVLRRVVTTGKADSSQANVPVTTGSVDAAWFSRPPEAGAIPWEIRFLGSTQYALVEHLDENSPDFEDALRQTERRLADAVAAKR